MTHLDWRETNNPAKGKSISTPSNSNQREAVPTDCLRKGGSGQKAFATLRKYMKHTQVYAEFLQRMQVWSTTLGCTVVSGTCLSGTRILLVLFPGGLTGKTQRSACTNECCRRAVWRSGYRWWLSATSQCSPQPASQICAGCIFAERRSRGNTTPINPSFIQLMFAKGLLCVRHRVTEPGLQAWTNKSVYTCRVSLHFSYEGERRE